MYLNIKLKGVNPLYRTYWLIAYGSKPDMDFVSSGFTHVRFADLLNLHYKYYTNHV